DRGRDAAAALRPARAAGPADVRRVTRRPRPARTTHYEGRVGRRPGPRRRCRLLRMGRDVRCRVRAGGREAEARVLLEPNELVARGDLKLRTPSGAVRGVGVRGDTLAVDGPDGPVEIDVGAADAERWAARIRNPPTLRQRLGLADDASVAVFGEPDEEL